ncbi:hypothetical protein OLMES_4239 [Oleiphilus messinensis]|uniref:Uncharacterized protein n=1 Tax=Oleiphilus messinensis TaxID=141451 RepID=A0A1Y0IFI4_9GAMM|nr:hypothetical protein OLMES_4239 [Oleiphilus messinensis]
MIVNIVSVCGFDDEGAELRMSGQIPGVISSHNADLRGRTGDRVFRGRKRKFL